MEPGTGVFTSTPVAGAVTAAGIFLDPNIAGVGSHKVTHTYLNRFRLCGQKTILLYCC